MDPCWGLFFHNLSARLAAEGNRRRSSTNAVNLEVPVQMTSTESAEKVMGTLTKPKRALLAYCALADSLHRTNANLLQALTPFLAPVCSMHAGKLFDAAEFSDAVFSLYGLRIPRLAVLGLAEQLERDKLLIPIAGKASKPVFQYATAKTLEIDDAHPVTEAEIDRVLADFTAACRDDPLLASESDQALHEEFLERLLHTDSMKLLSRREGTGTPKQEEKTLTLKKPVIDPVEQRVLRLDFHVAQYLLDLQAKTPDLFNRVSDIAFANMAAEALACFSEPADGATTLDGLTVYLDSPLLLDVLGVNVDYTEYGLELLQMLQDAGARPAVFDDCIAEAESVVAAQIAAQRTGLAQRASQWGTSAKPYVLTALMKNTAARAEAQGFEVHRDPSLDLLKKAKTTVGDIQADMTKRMQSWGNDEARLHDERSVWAMLRVRSSTTVCNKVSESKAIFIARNTSLVRIANDAWRKWLTDCTRNSKTQIDRAAPVALSDKQLAGYLWLRRGTGNGKMSKARLLAHCSAAIRPRTDVKAKAYNLVLSLHGKQEADHIAALLEDRDGERALMRATRADPEDVTKDRLPFIIEQVKLAAGEFAAKVARDAGEADLEAAKKVHQEELNVLQSKALEEKAEVEERVKSFGDALAQERSDRKVLEAQVNALTAQRNADEVRQRQDRIEKLNHAFHVGIRAYGRLRFQLVALFGACSLWVATSATEWDLLFQLISAFVSTCLGFWFIPEYLEGVVRWHARKQTVSQAQRLGVDAFLPSDLPDFKARSWAGLNSLRACIQSLN